MRRFDEVIYITITVLKYKPTYTHTYIYINVAAGVCDALKMFAHALMFAQTGLLLVLGFSKSCAQPALFAYI